MSQGVGTPYFMAPELLRMDPRFTNKVDVYSFGITLAGTINGKQPYEDQGFASEFEFARRVVGGMRPNVMNAGGMPSDLIKLMEECWDADPHKRPSFETVMGRIKVILDSLRGPSRRP